MNKDLNYYLNLPYMIWLVPSDEEDGGWLAKIPDLPGCITFGDARIAWISHRFEEGYLILEPVGSPEA